MERPKRRKYKDNPYIIKYYEEKDIYTVKFVDSKSQIQEVQISESVFSAFDQFELKDLSLMNKDDLHRDKRYVDTTEQSEINIFQHSDIYNETVEDIAETNIRNEILYKAISSLPSLQKNRIIKYYFEDKTLQEIADEEGCSRVSIKNSIDIALRNLYEKLKKNKKLT